jgi:hypothetical protein
LIGCWLNIKIGKWLRKRLFEQKWPRMNYNDSNSPTGAWGMDFVSSSPFSLPPLFFSKFSYKSFLFQNFHNHSFFFIWQYQLTSWIIRVFCVQFFDWYSIREKVISNSIFIFRAISITSVWKPRCFLHFLPCLHMALSYQTVSKILT